MLEGKNNWKAWIYLAPSLVLLGLWSFYPMVKSFILAFIRDYHPVSSVYQENLAANKAAGLTVLTFSNFTSVFKDSLFGYSVANTLLIAFVSVPISVIFSLIVSVVLVSIKKLKGFFQTLFFLPYVTSAMAVAMAFTVLFTNSGTGKNISNGPINSALVAVGLNKPISGLLDSMEWSMNGKKLWLSLTCTTKAVDPFNKDGSLKSDDQLKAELAAVTDTERLTAKYQDYVADFGDPNLGFIGTPDYTNKEDYQVSLLKTKSTGVYEGEYIYNRYRHHFAITNSIDWVGGNATWGSAIFVVLLYSIWGGMAFKILVFTGGLTGIDKQYYDAAKIDNTSKWRTFWKITVPMMSPLIVYILITSLIGSFKTYTSIVGLYGAEMGPASQPGIMMTFVGIVYKYLNQGNELIHKGAAAAVALFILIFVITKLTNSFTKKRTHY